MNFWPFQETAFYFLKNLLELQPKDSVAIA